MNMNVTVRGFINGVPVFPQHQLIVGDVPNAIELEVPGYLFIRMWPGVSYTVTVQYAA